MKVLFISSRKRDGNISPITMCQAKSLYKIGILIDFISIKSGPIGYLEAFFKIKKKCNSDKYDLIHAHYGLSGIIAHISKPKNIPILVSFMGSDLLGSTNKSGRYIWVTLIMARMIRVYSKFCDGIIVKSKKLFQELPKNPKNKKIRIIPNGVDIDVFRPIDKTNARSKIGLISRSKIILFAANPDNLVKNYDLAFKSVNMLKANGLAVDMICLSGIEHKLIPYYLNASDVVLLVSFHEGSPNVIKEAMACNCAIVATDVGDVKSNLSGVNNCYISSYDPVDVAEKIMLAINSNKVMNGREKIIDMGLDSQSIAKQILELYLEVTNE